MSQREIKFRAWDREEKRMIDYFHETYLWEDYQSDRYGVMQYTGLHDKNGKEIYEGDIIKTPYGMSRIFERLGCWFVEMQKELGYFTIDEPIEVIGNIYENPDLLKEKND